MLIFRLSDQHGQLYVSLLGGKEIDAAPTEHAGCFWMRQIGMLCWDSKRLHLKKCF